MPLNLSEVIIIKGYVFYLVNVDMSLFWMLYVDLQIRDNSIKNDT